MYAYYAVFRFHSDDIENSNFTPALALLMFSTCGPQGVCVCVWFFFWGGGEEGGGRGTPI